MTALNRGMFNVEDFVNDSEHGGVVLTPIAAKRFFGEYERFMLAGGQGGGPGGKQHFRRSLQEEVENVARALRDGVVYRPFALEEETAAVPARTPEQPEETQPQ